MYSRTAEDVGPYRQIPIFHVNASKFQSDIFRYPLRTDIVHGKGVSFYSIK